MRTSLTKLNSLLILIVLFTTNANAQFYRFIPEASNYINSDVVSDSAGLTFRYMWQDPSLGIKKLIIRTDNDGQALWMKMPSQSFNSMLMMSDSSMIISGGRSITNGNRIALLQKINADGSISWVTSAGSSSGSVSISNILTTNGKIIVTGSRSSFSSSTDFSKGFVAAFDTSGAVLWTRCFANAGLTTDYLFSRTMIAANGDLIAIADIRGSSGIAANAMMITRITPEGVMVFAKYVNFLEDTRYNQLSVTALAETATGEIVFGGRLMTDQISIYPNSMWLGKLDNTGEMLLQKTYSSGTDTGELLHSVRYADGRLYAYAHRYAPFDSVTPTRTFWVGELDPQTLSFTSQNALAAEVTMEDPYGQVANSFCITSNGKPTFSAGMYCTANNKYLPVMAQMTAGLETSCSELEADQPFTDSITDYPVTDYVPQGSFTLVYGTDTTRIRLYDQTAFSFQDACEGCVSTLAVSEQSSEAMILIYPNPTNGKFYIHSDTFSEQDEVTIYTTVGETIYRGNLSSSATLIDLDGHSPGMYYVRVARHSGNATIQKVIKSN